MGVGRACSPGLHTHNPHFNENLQAELLGLLARTPDFVVLSAVKSDRRQNAVTSGGRCATRDGRDRIAVLDGRTGSLLSFRQAVAGGICPAADGWRTP
jgi:hypothetical protein